MLRSAGSRSDVLKARYAFAVAQLELRRLLIARPRKQYNPNQPRVLPAVPRADDGRAGGAAGAGHGRNTRSSDRADFRAATASLLAERRSSRQPRKHAWISRQLRPVRWFARHSGTIRSGSLSPVSTRVSRDRSWPTGRRRSKQLHVCGS